MSYDYHFEIGDPPRKIVISTNIHCRRLDGMDVRLYDQPAWCFECEDVVGAEWLPPLEQLRAQLPEMKRRLRNRRRELKETQRTLNAASRDEARVIESARGDVARAEQNLLEADALAHWRHRRRSPPRCLRCGSTDIRDLSDIGGEAVRLPNGGEIRLVSTSFASYLRIEYGIYDAEGVRLDVPHPDKTADADPSLRQRPPLRLG